MKIGVFYKQTNELQKTYTSLCMTIFTYYPVRKPFFISLTMMVSCFFILKFSSPNNITSCYEKQGASMVALKNMYRSIKEKSFTGIKTLESKTGIKEITYYSENYFPGDKSITTKEKKITFK
ncbi:MAG: hypothetical protein ABI855_06875 [Bacteroidota bacterium]